MIEIESDRNRDKEKMIKRKKIRRQGQQLRERKSDKRDRMLESKEKLINYNN